MTESQIEELVEMVRTDQLQKHDLIGKVRRLVADNLKPLRTSWEYSDFIALVKVLSLPTDEVLVQGLKEAYFHAAIGPPHWGGNTALGLPEFVDGMKELGVSDEQISDYICQTLEYRVVEGYGFGGILECVGIPFVKQEPVRAKVKEKLKGLQRAPTSFRSNPNATYKSSWEGRARNIERLFRENEEALYELARINEEVDTNFDYRKEISPWRQKANVEDEKYPGIVNIKPELLSDEGREGKYKRLLTRKNQILGEIGVEKAYDRAVDRAVELAQLDNILNSDYIGGASGKTGAMVANFYAQMLRFAKVIGMPDAAFDAQVKAKERYGIDL